MLSKYIFGLSFISFCGVSQAQTETKFKHSLGIGTNYSHYYLDKLSGWDRENGNANFGYGLSYSISRKKMKANVSIGLNNQQTKLVFTDYVAPWAIQLRTSNTQYIYGDLEYGILGYSHKNSKLYFSQGVHINKVFKSNYDNLYYNNTTNEKEYHTDTFPTQFGFIFGVSFEKRIKRLSIIPSIKAVTLLRAINEYEDGRPNFWYGSRTWLRPEITVSYNLQK